MEYTPTNRERNTEADRKRMRVSGQSLKLTIPRAPKLSAEEKKKVERRGR
jgi:hypothetical protein